MSGDHIQEGYASLREAAANAPGATKHGLSWLVKTLDPYHDRPLEIRGLPDYCEAKTIVRELRSSTYVTNSSLTANTTWSCHIDLLPLSRQITCAPAALTSGGQVEYTLDPEQNAVQSTLYPLTITKHTGDGLNPATNQCWPNGDYTITYSCGDVANSRVRTGLNPNWEDYGDQPYRVIGAAFEVINVTGELYKNGTCSVYRVNSEFDHKTQYLGYFDGYSLPPSSDGQGLGFWADTRIVSLPLNSLNDMAPLPTFQQWSAAEGCYVVGVLDPYCISDFTMPLDHCKFIGINRISSADYNILASSIYASAPQAPFSEDVMTGALTSYPAALHLNALQTCGAYFTNLDANTQLQINVRWIVESIPDAADQDMTLAQISAEYDPAVLELYARAIRKMPAGVPVRMNPFGEWFEIVMDTVASTATIIGTGVGALLENPAAGAKIGSYIGYGAEWLGNKNKRAREEGGKVWF